MLNRTEKYALLNNGGPYALFDILSEIVMF
jgi:hypothetical protein